MSLKDYNDSVIYATGMTRSDQFVRLTVSGGDGNTDEHREAHLSIYDAEGGFAQGWFRLDQLVEALRLAGVADFD